MRNSLTKDRIVLSTRNINKRGKLFLLMTKSKKNIAGIENNRQLDDFVKFAIPLTSRPTTKSKHQKTLTMYDIVIL